jgi:hypothetical protein
MFTQYGAENHLIISASSFQQSKQFGGWDTWQFPIGEWVGEGSGLLGQAAGGFSSNLNLNGRILVRKNHSEYPATNVTLKLCV